MLTTAERQTRFLPPPQDEAGDGGDADADEQPAIPKNAWKYADFVPISKQRLKVVADSLGIPFKEGTEHVYDDIVGMEFCGMSVALWDALQKLSPGILTYPDDCTVHAGDPLYFPRHIPERAVKMLCAPRTSSALGPPAHRSLRAMVALLLGGWLTPPYRMLLLHVISEKGGTQSSLLEGLPDGAWPRGNDGDGVGESYQCVCFRADPQALPASISSSSNEFHGGSVGVSTNQRPCARALPEFPDV